MELRSGYKQTEVGLIPEDWRCERIRDAAANTANAIVGGPFGSDLISADYAAAGVPVIRGQNMSAKFISGDFVFVSPGKAKSLAANLAYPGDLIFTQRGTLGQVSVVPGYAFENYLVSQSQMKVSLNRTRHDPQFVYQYFTSRAGQRQVLASAIQTGVPHTNLGILRAYQFPSPSLSEQRAIAAVLSDVDALLKGLTRLIAKKRDLKQAAMQQLLTGQTRVPGFHAKWEVKRLGDLAEMKSGGTPATSIPAYYNGNIPWVSISDMTKGGKVITATDRNLTHAGFLNSAAQMFPVGTVLYAMYASLGECSITGIPLCSSQAILGIRPFDDLSSEFLYYYLTSLKIIAKSLGQQGTQANLNKAMVQDFRLRLPSLPEQITIVAVLSDMDAELTALQVRSDKTYALKRAMMQELLTGKIRIVASPSTVVSADSATELKPAPRQRSTTKAHNWEINEAVVVAVLVKQFSSEEYPLGRKRCTKLVYLLHRHVERVAEGFLKKAAGPYNPAMKYKGPEGIAQRKGYIRAHKHDSYSGFVAAEKIGQAKDYFDKWYGPEVLDWLEQFRRTTNDELELLTTVDMAVEDLKRVNTKVSMTAVKSVISDHPEWQAKLEREIFSDANIVRAIRRVSALFSTE